MLSRFLEYISNHNLINNGQKVLLAVSGGADSVAMAQLFHKTEYTIGIAHCNFKLRGNESDNDEAFVRNLAEKFNVPFYCMHFNTEEYASLEKISIQVAARQLRYNWFENLRRQQGYDYIAVAHHADDAIETFFINLLRGTGIQGITGIRPLYGNIIRPLLFAYRDEIEKYCNQNNLEFRTDSTNNSDKYLRNRIRHSLIPTIEDLLPNYKSIMHDNLSRFSEAEAIYNEAIKNFSEYITENRNEFGCNISINKLFTYKASKTLLYEILKCYGFSAKTSEEIYSNIHGISGQTYFSNNYRLLKDRETLIIEKIATEITNEPVYYIDPNNNAINELPIKLNFAFVENKNNTIIPDKNIAQLDADKIQFPLLLRKWKTGDYFQPLGMKGIKKISDFFIDNKVSITQKENAWLITSADELVWIVGMRIDDRFKITSSTKHILIIELGQ